MASPKYFLMVDIRIGALEEGRPQAYGMGGLGTMRVEHSVAIEAPTLKDAFEIIEAFQALADKRAVK